MYDPGVLKLDATFTVHSSVGSIFHELNYEREMCSYSPTPQTPVIKEETRIIKAAEGDTGVDADAAHTERKNEEDEESLESGEGKNNESRRQSSLVNAASGGDNNSCPLSPSSIALELSTNDSNSSSETSRAASLRQSCGDARSTAGYVSETTNGSSHSTSSGGGAAAITSNQWEIPVFEDLTWQPSPANVGNGVEFRATGYVSDTDELRVTSIFSGGPVTPLPTGKEDCQRSTRGHRSQTQVSRYTSDSSGGVGCPSGYVTRETTMTARECKQQPAHQPGKQITHQTSAERTRGQQQQHGNEVYLHQECSEQHNIQQKQQIEQQQQQQRRQQNQQQARIERAESSLSLNIITDLEQAFPLASRFASYESLESLPQLMPTKPSSPPLGLGSTTPDQVPFEKSATPVQPTRPLGDYINLENNPRTPKSSPPNSNITLPEDSRTVSTDVVCISDRVERECVTACDCEPCSHTPSPGMSSGLDDLFSDENTDERGFANILFGLENTTFSEDYV